MPDTTNVQEYKLYYASNIVMTDMVLIDNHSTIEETSPGTFIVSGYNIEMEDNTRYYFTISALMTDGNEIFSTPYEGIFQTETDSTTITPVQDFQAETSNNKNNNILMEISGSESNGSQLTNGSGNLVLSAGITHVTDHAGNNDGAFNIQGTDYVAFPCYNGMNFNNNIGHIDFWYQCTGTPTTYGRFFAHSSQDFSLQRHESDTNINISWNGDQSFYIFSNVVNVFDGAWHHIVLRWNLSTDTVQLNIDANTYSANIPTMTWNLTQGDLYLGNRSTGDRSIGGAIDDLSICNTY